MRRHTLLTASLLIVVACSKKDDATSQPSTKPSTVETKPAAPAAAAKTPDAPAVAAPTTAPAATPTKGSADNNGGMVEVSVYGDGPDGKPLPFAHWKPAAGEKLFEGDVTGAAWNPGAGNGGAGDDNLDIALVTAGGKAEIVFEPTTGKRSTLPLGIAADSIEYTASAIEERGDHRAMIRVSAISTPDVEGTTEAYLVAWDAKAHAPTVAEHWTGLADKTPAWAVPTE